MAEGGILRDAVSEGLGLGGDGNEGPVLMVVAAPEGVAAVVSGRAVIWSRARPSEISEKSRERSGEALWEESMACDALRGCESWA